MNIDPEAGGHAPPEFPNLLRTPGAAATLGLSPATLSKYRCMGGGPAFYKLGRAVLYDRRDLEAWCASHGKQRSTADARQRL